MENDTYDQLLRLQRIEKMKPTENSHFLHEFLL